MSPLSLARALSTSAASAGKHKVLVIGGGTGGLAAANQVYNLFKARNQTLGDGDIAIVDANAHHDYQPGWTIVGSGLGDKRAFRRPLDSLIPAHFAHIKSNAASFEPGTNQVVLADGSKVGYDFMVVAPGIQINWDKVKGLPEALADPLKSNVSSIYSYETVDKTWDLIRNFQGPEAVFTQPFGPVKCAGAPQKIAYMADWYWKDQKRSVHSTFVTGMPTMFSQPMYAGKLNIIRQEKGIAGHFNTNLTEVRVGDKTAVFDILDGENKGQKLELPFGLLHVVPPMGPPDVIKKSPTSTRARSSTASSPTSLASATRRPSPRPRRRRLLPARRLSSPTTSSPSWSAARSARPATTATPRAPSSPAAGPSSSPSSSTTPSSPRRSLRSPTRASPTDSSTTSPRTSSPASTSLTSSRAPGSAAAPSSRPSTTSSAPACRNEPFVSLELHV
jgi:hypothetical protein